LALNIRQRLAESDFAAEVTGKLEVPTNVCQGDNQQVTEWTWHLAHRVHTQTSYYRNNRWEVYLLQL